MSQGIENKVVVITGASSGLGEATARHLAERGATVVIGARRLDRIEALAAELNAQGYKVVAVQTDVTDRDQVKNLVDITVKQFGRIDVMLNNAGLMPLAPLERLKVDEWDRMIDVNIKGVLYGIAAALPHMKAQKSGHIINVSSVYGHVVDPGATVYCATKHAVRALSEGLRKEVKPYNIRTTIISPGAVSTELLEHISEKDIQAGTMEFVSKIAIGPGTFARSVAFAIGEPDDVDINEILFRPTAQPV
ncbi:SDR family oxidoreductase [Rhizobium leguminosarum bv. viciae]|uniref:SDR family oxidoreductase n=1 Tax=Rhizobium leguminosarum TaxID=384 RepID=UPI00103CA817|nr:SDR family oxidoreductase [Rhizobium leguminosarum]TCA47822.1 SDR family oxidoreductase [Rhizobium leguminosarum bv. viciae]